MNIQVVSIQQEMNLEQGVNANFLILRLPSGQIIRALIDDDSLQTVIGAAAGHAPSPPPPQPEEQENGVRFFGGDASPSVEEARAPSIGHVDNALESPYAPDEPIPRPPTRARVVPRTVQSDEMGNPVVADSGVSFENYVEEGDDPGEAAPL